MFCSEPDSRTTRLSLGVRPVLAPDSVASAPLLTMWLPGSCDSACAQATSALRPLTDLLLRQSPGAFAKIIVLELSCNRRTAVWLRCSQKFCFLRYQAQNANALAVAITSEQPDQRHRKPFRKALEASGCGRPPWASNHCPTWQP